MSYQQPKIKYIKNFWKNEELNSTAVHAVATVRVEINGQEIDTLAVAYQSKPHEIYYYALKVPFEDIFKHIQRTIDQGESVGRVIQYIRKEMTTEQEEGYIGYEYLDMGDASEYFQLVYLEKKTKKIQSPNTFEKWAKSVEKKASLQDLEISI